MLQQSIAAPDRAYPAAEFDLASRAASMVSQDKLVLQDYLTICFGPRSPVGLPGRPRLKPATLNLSRPSQLGRRQDALCEPCQAGGGRQAVRGDPLPVSFVPSTGESSMDRWRVELGEKDEYLGIVEAENDDDAVEAAIKKFQISPSQRHKIMVTKEEAKRE